MLNFAIVRFLVRVIIYPFGWTICQDHFARWSILNDKIIRKLYPIGWRIARKGDTQPKSQLEQFLNERKPS